MKTDSVRYHIPNVSDREMKDTTYSGRTQCDY